MQLGRGIAEVNKTRPSKNSRSSGLGPWPATALLAVFLSIPAHAAVQQHTFTATGTNGETGSGAFTWDNTVVPDGGALNSNTPGQFLTFQVTIVGGNTAGGSASFTLANCASVAADSTPTFTGDINVFTCNDGTTTLSGVNSFTANLSGVGNSIITFAPGTTTPTSPPAASAQAVPVFPHWALLASVLGLGFIARRKYR